MATVPVPRTWTVGELLTAAKLNVDVRDGLNFLLAPPLATLTKNASQSYATAAYTGITWPTELVDRDGGHSTSTNTNRYTAATAGYYSMYCFANWSLESASGYRRLGFRVNGTTIGHQEGRPATASIAMSHLSGLAFMSVGDYVEVMADQNSGVTLTIVNSSQWDIIWSST